MQGLTKHTVHTADQATEMLRAGLSSRTQLERCRTHFICTIHVTSYSVNNQHATRRCNLSLVDLAECQRQPAGIADIASIRRNTFVNKSLFALHRCLKALAEKAAYIPYRDSVLTKLLSRSMGGGGYATLLCNVTPCWQMASESLKVLQFCQQAIQASTLESSA